MQIVLKDMKGSVITRVPVATDERGYLCASHPTFGFEVDCALYLYQDGGFSEDVIHDLYTDEPYIQWTIEA